MRGCIVKKNGKFEYLMLVVIMGDFVYDDGMWMVYLIVLDYMILYLKVFVMFDRMYKVCVGMVNGSVVMVEGKGDVKIMMKGVRKVIKNVFFVSGINRNVLSISKLMLGGGLVEIGGGECIIKDEIGKVFVKSRFDERGIVLCLKVIR